VNVKWHVDYGPEDQPDAFLDTPKWSDEAAVTRWVCERVDYDEFTSIEFENRDMRELFKAAEREAVAAARNGNFAPLAALLKSKNEGRLYGQDFHIGPEAYALIAARLENPRGKRGKRGAPVLTAEQRQLWELGNPVYAAARETKAIEKWFRQFFCP
jgi:hypothetical protein